MSLLTVLIMQHDSSHHALTIAVTLRLLWLLAQNAEGLSDVFNDGLTSTPIAPWKHIIPQIFARLGHPRGSVRALLRALLVRISEHDPQAIVFPAVVGSSSDPAGEYGLLCETLQERVPEQMASARLLVTELNRISLLPEERWISVLQRLQGSIAARVRMLRDDMQRLRMNESITQEERERVALERFSTVMRPVIADVERAMRMDTVPETPHEHTFAVRGSGTRVD